MRAVEPQSDPVPSPGATLEFTCPACGAETAYAPGTITMKCPKCGAEEHIDAGGEQIDEHSYKEWDALPEKPVHLIGKQVLQCDNCGATTETDLIADTCRFCKGVLDRRRAGDPEWNDRFRRDQPFGILDRDEDAAAADQLALPL